MSYTLQLIKVAFQVIFSFDNFSHYTIRFGVYAFRPYTLSGK